MNSRYPTLELRPVAAPSAADGNARVYVLLPRLEELLQRPGFGRRDAICLPGGPRPYEPRHLFGSARFNAVLH